MIRFARFMLVFALMVSIGGQWAVLQSAAWLGMAVSYSIKAGSVSEGLSKTFDGEHPCKLCCIVKKGTDSEKKDSKQETTKKKLELFASNMVIIIMPLVAAEQPTAENELAFSWSTAPPHQPPRCA